MLYSSSKQVQTIRSLYESICTEPLTEERQNKLLMIELYNTLVIEGFIKGSLIENEVITEGAWTKIGGAVTKYGPKIGPAIASAASKLTGFGQPLTKKTVAKQVVSGLAGGSTITNPQRTYNTVSGGIQGAVSGYKKPTEKPEKAQYNSFDVFDAIKGHLIDEGYADTEDAALKIMANMSEEWRESIVEEVLEEGDNYDKNRKRAAQRAAARNAARDAGKTGAVPGVGYVTPRRERETYTDAAGTERHKSGARMPKD